MLLENGQTMHCETNVAYNYHIDIEFRRPIKSGPMKQWCEDNIGNRGHGWDLDFNLSTGVFLFQKHEDAFAFALKWS